MAQEPERARSRRRLAARWLAALADAVQHAHDRGILHRDIKPDNVILTCASGPDDFIPRLTDFGLAKLIEEPGDETRSGARMGTPHYMAPEQAAGLKSEVGPATDVYALGATLYEVLDRPAAVPRRDRRRAPCDWCSRPSRSPHGPCGRACPATWRRSA